MTLPYLFLDVDGVINAFDGKNVGDWPDFKKVKVYAPRGGPYGPVQYGFNMRFSKQMCGALQVLPVDLRWATTWEHLANDLLGVHTGFNECPVACYQGDDDDDWKFTHVLRIVEEDPRPLIWCDDEAIPPHAGETFDSMGVPHLLIQPDCMVGLTRAHLDEMRRFVGLQPKYVDAA